jgi:hypothetical protein
MQKLMAKQQSITSLPRSPEDDRRARMIKYSVTMGIRLVCILVCFLVPGYWIIIPAVGAIVLPYVAVVLANVSGGRQPTLVRPDQLALPPADATAAAEERADDERDRP